MWWRILRIFTLFLILGVPTLVYINPNSIYDLYDISYYGVIDLVAWGENKIMAVTIIQNSTDVQIPGQYKFKDLDSILNENDDF